MRTIILALIQRWLSRGMLAVLLATIGPISAHAGKEVVPKPKLTPLNPDSNISAIMITVQVDPIIDVDPAPTQLPNIFALQQNYPNPFNSSTTITFSCAKESFVSMKVYNILGQEVATLVSKRMKPGLHSITWNSRDREGKLLPSGVYLYRMRTDWYNETRKLLILR